VALVGLGVFSFLIFCLPSGLVYGLRSHPGQPKNILPRCNL
jgi:hypothetical protein